MQEFYFVESSRKNAIQGLILWFFVFTSFSLIIFVGWEDNPTFMKYLSFFIFLVATITIIILYKIYKSDGYWEISIKDSKLIWHTPNNKQILGEEPFELNLSKVKKIIGKESKNLDEIVVSYQLVLVNGDVRHLMTSCSVNMAELIEILKNNGVLYEYQKI